MEVFNVYIVGKQKKKQKKKKKKKKKKKFGVQLILNDILVL